MGPGKDNAARSRPVVAWMNGAQSGIAAAATFVPGTCATQADCRGSTLRKPPIPDSARLHPGCERPCALYTRAA